MNKWPRIVWNPCRWCWKDERIGNWEVRQRGPLLFVHRRKLPIKPLTEKGRYERG